jgi:uncharacterized protein
MNALRQHFALTLMVNHACNLRCSYCYTGAKFSRPMPFDVGATAIKRAFQSLTPTGCLDLVFFGGEPLLEANRILEWMNYARDCSVNSGRRFRFSLTTNGTVTHREAWQIMMTDDVELAVSFDGTPQIHNRHRLDVKGGATAALVETTIRRLIEAEKCIHVVVVVRPDNLEQIPEGLQHLYRLGVRQVDLSLDLWTSWSSDDGRRLQKLVESAAELWRQWLPEFSLNWFDARAVALARLPMTEQTTVCGFGVGEIAVAPSGHLYPCERVIGEDRPNHPLRLPGHALDDGDLLSCATKSFARCEPCSQCALAPTCDTTCRCSNFIRTGDVNRPDGLLCILNKAAFRATADALKLAASVTSRQKSTSQQQEQCYV